MPCYTKVLVNLKNTKWNRMAREKLGLPLEGGLTEVQAKDVRVEAGRLKTTAEVKMMNPAAMVQSIGKRKLTININI
jgi:hypothetical protein